MGHDVPESLGFQCRAGNNVFLNVGPDTRAETERLFNALAEGGRYNSRCRTCSGAPTLAH